MNNPLDGGVSSDDPRVIQFREAFAGTAFHLLEPLHPDVNYSFEVMAADPWTLEFRADKWWFSDNGRVENSTLTLNTYDLEQDEVQRETVREEALMEREDLLRIYAAQGLEAAMQKAEDIAIDNDHLDEDRDDPRFFTEGPEDRFFTQREQAIVLDDLFEDLSTDLEEIPQEYLWQDDSDPKTWELEL